MKKTVKPANQVEVSTTLTKLESEVLRAVVNGLYAEWGFSDIDAKDISKETKIATTEVRGVLASLIQKGLVFVDDNGAGFKVITLTEVGAKHHKAYAEELGLVYEPIVIVDEIKPEGNISKNRANGVYKQKIAVSKSEDELLTDALDKTKRDSSLASHAMSKTKVGNTEVAIIKKTAPKSNSKVNYNKMTYQELAKAYGNGFVGKNKQTLIDLLTKGGK